MSDADKVGAAEKIPEDPSRAAAATESAAPYPTQPVQPWFDRTVVLNRRDLLALVGTAGVILLGVISLMWFVYGQHSEVKDLIHQTERRVDEAMHRQQDLKQEVEGLRKAHAESETDLLEAIRDHLTGMCDALGSYNFEYQYCEINGKKILYRLPLKRP